ncbi:hypothetical protein CsSME_00016860 [Camellia sinensis var. sinensis]
MEGRGVIRSDSFACDGHCSIRSMKTHPSGRSSRTSSSHRPISGTCSDITVPLCRSFSFSVHLSLSPSISAANHRFLSLALWRSSDAKIDKAQPAIKIRLEFWGE